MHDWVISTFKVDWDKSEIDITFKTSSGVRHILATDFVEINIPKKNEWGPSASVYKVDSPVQLKNKNAKISIQMQSGDTITIEARQIILPSEFRGNVGNKC